MKRCCSSIPLQVADRASDAALFKLLGDPHRLAILDTLAAAAEPVCVCDFTDALPLNQPTVSHHLKLLRDGGLIKAERRGTWMYYRLADDAAARVDAAAAIFSQKRTVQR